MVIPKYLIRGVDYVLPDTCIVNIGDVCGDIDRMNPLESRINLEGLKGTCRIAENIIADKHVLVPECVYEECRYAYELARMELNIMKHDVQSMRGKHTRADPMHNVQKLDHLVHMMKRALGKMKIAHPQNPEAYDATVGLVKQVEFTQHHKRGNHTNDTDERLAAMAIYFSIWEGMRAEVATADFDVYHLFCSTCEYIAQSPYVDSTIKEALVLRPASLFFDGKKIIVKTSDDIVRNPGKVIQLNPMKGGVKKWLEIAGQRSHLA